MQWLRRSFLAGLFVTVPLVVSVATLVWAFRAVDAIAEPLSVRLFGQPVPGVGVLATAALVVVVGAVATNVIGRRLLQQGQAWLLRVPVFKTVYAPIRQLAAAFAPDNEAGFKRVVLVDDPGRGRVMGFLTREFVLEGPQGEEEHVAVYVPTNHLYLGDVLVLPRRQVSFPDVTVEDGIRIFLTGGMALPDRLRVLPADGRVAHGR